jgi:hypothetical protein
VYGQERFVCPECRTATRHNWYNISTDDYELGFQYMVGSQLLKDIEEKDRAISICTFCESCCYWIGGNLIYPHNNFLIPDPNEDLPDNIKGIYMEARSIFQYSSRSSAALIRLALESLLTGLGYNQNRLVDKINALVEAEGTTDELVMAAEIIRHYGNSSAHAGFIDLNEEKESAEQLFMVLNLIAEHLYTRPKRLNSLIERLPKGKREEIEKKLGKLNK